MYILLFDANSTDNPVFRLGFRGGSDLCTSRTHLPESSAANEHSLSCYDMMKSSADTL